MSIFKISNLSISFNNVSVLKDLNFSIESKGLTMIVGKSGCGKSTLLNLLMGIEKPTEGTIEFMSRNVGKMTEKEFAYYHAYEVSTVFQHYNLLTGLSALENVTLPLLIRGERKHPSIKRAKELFSLFNLEQIIDQEVSTLSGGEKQRVAILRALITKPKVILCDEPTGALDSKNSTIVMDTLKTISNDISVIVVSHNNELVKKYANRVISLQNGQIISDLSTICEDKYLVPYKKKTLKNSSWNDIFVKKIFKENKKRNVLSITAISFGFLCIFLAFGFANGSKASQNEAIKNNYAKSYAKISSKTYFEIEGSPFTYEKSTRPSLEEIDSSFSNADFISFETNLDYAFSPYPYAKYNGNNVNSFTMIPLLFDSTEISQVIINQEMANLLDYDEAIDKEIIISHSASFSLPTNDLEAPFVKDTFSYEIALKVKNVINEFPFLNTPKIYYSYNASKVFLKSSILENISKYKKKSISVFDFIETSSNDDVASSYCLNAFLTDPSKSDEFFSLIDNNQNSESVLKLDSTPYEIKKTYTDFINSFSDALTIFVLITFIGVLLIIGILSLSLFIERKKESAILRCLGSKTSSIVNIYLKNNAFIIFISFLISLGLSFPLQILLNTLISKSFGLNSLISIPFYSYFGIKLLLPSALLFIGLFLSSIFVLIPILIYKKFPLSSELKDE